MIVGRTKYQTVWLEAGLVELLEEAKTLLIMVDLHFRIELKGI
jgi:hypothetical protein